MKSIELDENNQIKVVQGNIRLLSGVQSCAQDVKTRLGLCKGENIFNTEEGIDYDNEALGKFLGKDYIKGIVRSRILESEEIVGVNSLSFSKNGSNIELNSEITSIYGEIKI